MLKDAIKKSLLGSVFAFVMGAIAFVYYLTPYAEQEIEFVVTDKWESPSAVHNKPYVVEYCKVNDIKNCSTVRLSKFIYDSTPTGEKFTMSVPPNDIEFGHPFRFLLSILSFVAFLFGVCLWAFSDKDGMVDATHNSG